MGRTMRHASSSILRVTTVTLTSALVIASCTGSEAVEPTEGAGPTEAAAESIVSQGPETTLVLTEPEPEKAGDTVTGTVGETYSIDPGLQPFIDLAVEDLAERSGADPEDITVRNAYLVTWPDSSLGCPEPGKVYLPAVNDGSVIELVLDETVYRYHTGGNLTEPFLCEEPSGDETVVESSARDASPLDGTPLELDKPVEKYPDETVPSPGYDD